MNTVTMSDEPIKPGYKLTEVGVIPEDWTIQHLASLCTSIVDGTHFTPKYVEDGIPFYSVENVTANDFTNTKFISSNEHRLLTRRCKPEKGDILMTRIGSLGITKLIDWEVDASIYVSLALLKPSQEVVPDYLNTYSKSRQFVRDVEKRSLVNATPQKINMQDIGSIPIPVPPTENEQRAIAEALSDVDALLDALDRLTAKKRAIKQSAMHALLTGRVRLPGFTRKPGYKRTEVGLIPEDWEVKTYAELFDFLPTSSCSRSDLSDSGEMYYIHYGDIHTKWNFRLDFHRHAVPRIEAHKVKGAARLRDGDLIVADASEDEEGVAKSVEVTNLGDRLAVAGLHTIALRSKGEDLVIGFKAYLQANQVVRSQVRHVASGLKVFGISKSSIGDILVPLPHPQEQSAIAEVLSDMDAEIDALEKRRAKLRDIKQGMMQELLTGRIRLMQPKEKTQEAHV